MAFTFRAVGESLIVIVFMVLGISVFRLRLALSRLRARMENERSEKKKTADALRNQNRLVKGIVDHAASGLFLVDALGRPSYVNPAYLELTGFAASELASRDIHSIFH